MAKTKSAAEKADSSVLRAMQRFWTHTSMSGLSHMRVAESRPRTLAWAVVWAVGTVATLKAVTDTVVSYLSFDVITTVSTVYEDAVPFPTVALCNLNRVNCGFLLSVKLISQMK
jgi:hypothetical protein